MLTKCIHCQFKQQSSAQLQRVDLEKNLNCTSDKNTEHHLSICLVFSRSAALDSCSPHRTSFLRSQNKLNKLRVLRIDGAQVVRLDIDVTSSTTTTTTQCWCSVSHRAGRADSPGVSLGSRLALADVRRTIRKLQRQDLLPPRTGPNMGKSSYLRTCSYHQP